jgi:hypothetical protein
LMKRSSHGDKDARLFHTADIDTMVEPWLYTSHERL